MKTKLPALKDAIKLHKDMDQYEKDLSFIHEQILPELGGLEDSDCVIIESVPPGAVKILRENGYPIQYSNRNLIVYRNYLVYLFKSEILQDILAVFAIIALLAFTLLLLLGPFISCFIVGNFIPMAFYALTFPILGFIFSRIEESSLT